MVKLLEINMFSVPHNFQVNDQNQHFNKIGGEMIIGKENTEGKNPLQCSICGLIVSNKWNFTLHMRVHNNDRRYKCNQCPSSFITSHDLKRHTLAHEGVKPRFKCQFCPKTYASRHSKYLHEDSHNQLEYKCRHCPQIFPKFIDRNKHEKEFHSKDNVFFSCSECVKKFTSKRFLENHERNYHKKEQGGFVCDECGVIFETSVNLNIHRRTHTNKTIVINETDTSGRQSNTVKTLKKKTPIELFGIRIHECIICTKRYTSRSDMLRHMSTTHPEENKAIFKYSCNVCDKHFKCKQGLSQHLIMHNGEKKFSCKLCDYKSKRSADLKVHMRKHTGEAPYVCDKCGKRFQHVKSFQHHKKEHFGKIFKCSVCDASFYRSRELDWHRQKHSLGGFKCFKCGKLLANPYSLKTHLRIRKCEREKGNITHDKKSETRICDNVLKTKMGNKKSYECFACGYSTFSSLDIVKHQALHSGDSEQLDNQEPVENKASDEELQPQGENYLRKIVNGPFEKTSYKGIITSHSFYVNTSFLTSCPSVEQTLKMPDDVSAGNTNQCQFTEYPKESSVHVDGRTFVAIEDLKKLDPDSLIHYVKNLT